MEVYVHSSAKKGSEQLILGGERGRVKAAKLTKNNKVLLDGESDTGNTILVENRALFLYKSDDDSIARQMQHFRTHNNTFQLEHLYSWMPAGLFARYLFHRAAQDPESWCPEEEINAFLQDDAKIDHLVEAIKQLTIAIITWADQQGHHLDNMADQTTFSNCSFCPGCSTRPDDRDPAIKQFACQAVPENQTLTYENGVIVDFPVAARLHMLTAAIDLTCSLLKRESFGKLLSALTREEQLKNIYAVPASFLHDFVRKAGKCFPTAAQKACGLISFISCLDPLANFPSRRVQEQQQQQPDEYDLIVQKHFLGLEFSLALSSILVDPLIEIGQIFSEENIPDVLAHAVHYSTLSMLDMLPCLYFTATWRQCFTDSSLQRLISRLASVLNQSLVVAFLYPHCINRLEPDLKKYPQKRLKAYSLESMLAKHDDSAQLSWRLEFLRKHPASFAAAAVLELLAWWVYKGWDVSKIEFIANNPDNSQMGILEVMALTRENISHLITLHPCLSYLTDIVATLSEGMMPGKPVRSTYLLYEPLYYADRRCGLATCRKTAQELDLPELLRCSGGCEELQQYCCREHQLADWKAHKHFCKKNARVVND